MMRIPISEKDLQRGVSDYLQIGMNQGKWWFTRLNSGMAYKKHGDKYYAIKLCEKGTADFVFMKSCFENKNPWMPQTIVIFLELKSTKGKQTQEQQDFQKMAEAQGCEYCVIRSIDELIIKVSQG